MDKSESPKRAAECTRLAGDYERSGDAGVFIEGGVILDLVAAELNEHLPEGSRRLKTLQDLVGLY